MGGMLINQQNDIIEDLKRSIDRLNALIEKMSDDIKGCECGENCCK